MKTVQRAWNEGTAVHLRRKRYDLVSAVATVMSTIIQREEILNHSDATVFMNSNDVIQLILAVGRIGLGFENPQALLG
jgi:DNA-binding response OmpR family regulator